MIEKPPQDIWSYRANCVVITTNGFVRKDGSCVMGRGIAFQAKKKFPGIEFEVGRTIRVLGNHVYMMGLVGTFPVKHNWWEKADLELIRRSAIELGKIAGSMPPAFIFAMPRPGCHNGGRSWEEVRPLLVDVLPNNVHIVDYVEG